MSEEQKPHAKAMVLTRSERIMFQGIQSREREAERVVLQPIREDLQEVLHGIHERLELPPGAIGTTHSLDTESWTVLPNPPPSDREGPENMGDPKMPPEGDGFEEASVDGDVLTISASPEANGAHDKPVKHRR